MTAPFRWYRCVSPQCEQYGVEHEVAATAVGLFWSWPALRCVCDAEPAQIGDTVPASAASAPYPGEDDLVDVVTRSLWPDLGDRLTATRAVRVVLDEQARLARAATPARAERTPR